MGVLNITPDSFSDGGQLMHAHAPALDRVCQRAERMIAEGAAILDIGGESTRPGAASVTPQQELERVIPVIECLRQRFDVALSVDTSAPQVMRAAVAAGATIINDVRALMAPGALVAAAELNVTVCLMHLRGEPQSMQDQPEYDDVVAAVGAFLSARAGAAQGAGISATNIWLDPGFGFGKTLAHNLQLFNALPHFAALGFPVLVGVSRKSMVGAICNRELDQRVTGSAVLAGLAVDHGATIVRVHDVAATADAINIHKALRDALNEADL